MTAFIVGRRSELGGLIPMEALPDGVCINVAGQQANTLLHDGHAWKDFARTMRAGVQRARRSGADRLVHASFAFVHEMPPMDPLRSLAAVILECEQAVLDGPMPACVVRLGYLYGPGSGDLRAYRLAFRLGRPYWAGPRRAGQYHLHHGDAVRALTVAAARSRARGRICYAVGGPPVPFMAFMDHFARRVGNRLPLHAPRLAAPLFKAVVREAHMQQVALAMPDGLPSPRLPGWMPTRADWRAALDAAVASWADA